MNKGGLKAFTMVQSFLVWIRYLFDTSIFPILPSSEDKIDAFERQEAHVKKLWFIVKAGNAFCSDLYQSDRHALV
jgi:hypothetical protein